VHLVGFRYKNAKLRPIYYI